MEKKGFLIYGANGYTGELIARYAKDYGLYPIIAGRSREAIEHMAAKSGFPYLVFDVNDSAALKDALSTTKLIVNAAGPFQFTARQIIESCLETGTHYIDINGDISVFEMIRAYDNAAKDAGIMLLPGAGFDVVPTDCLALFLKNRLPDATHLRLAFATLGGGISHGTATTMASRLGEPGAMRRNGSIVPVPLGHHGMEVDFGIKKLFVMSIPWGDISTAYHSTGIPTIESYTGISKKLYYLLKIQSLFNWVLRKNVVRKFIKKRIDSAPAGPSDRQRSKAISLVWGEASNTAGQKITARSSGPEGYSYTLHSCLAIAGKILNNNFKAGYQTPATAYGEDLPLEIPGVKREIVDNLNS
jgi:short subunit dehydrogenase-like uncharacterized protein